MSAGGCNLPKRSSARGGGTSNVQTGERWETAALVPVWCTASDRLYNAYPSVVIFSGPRCRVAPWSLRSPSEPQLFSLIAVIMLSACQQERIAGRLRDSQSQAGSIGAAIRRRPRAVRRSSLRGVDDRRDDALASRSTRRCKTVARYVVIGGLTSRLCHPVLCVRLNLVPRPAQAETFASSPRTRAAAAPNRDALMSLTRVRRATDAVTVFLALVLLAGSIAASRSFSSNSQPTS